MQALNNLRRHLKLKEQFNKAKTETVSTNYVEELKKQWLKEKNRNPIREDDRPTPDFTYVGLEDMM